MSPEQAIETMSEKFFAAYATGDMSKLADCYASDAVYMPPGSPALSGWEQIEAHQRAAIETLRPEFEITPVETLESGDLIVQRGTYKAHMSPKDNDPFDETGKYVIVCRRRSDGTAEIFWDIDNSDGSSD